MKLYFLRHTSLNIGLDIFYGQTDIDVSSTFKSEVRVIKKKLVDEKVNLQEIRIFSSPLKRCIKLAKQLKEKYTIDYRLKEMNLGDWEMKEMDSISNEDKLEWENNLLTYKIPNGESNQEFLARLDDFLNDILKKSEDILIVAHAGSINGMISKLTKEPFDKLVKNYWEKITYGSLSLVEIKEGLVTKRFIGK
ncbi:MAG: histidine phosphatase family protein [Pseudomonadota bacterium]|nr:histidine phosphatase family protein [Pseudomonadota bacterium]